MSKRRTFLIVEDDYYSYELLKEILPPDENMHYHSALGSKAIDICRDKPEIDLVLMDIKLPDINGCEATREIKKIRPDLPVIALTACTLNQDKEQCLQAGCDYYIPKPIDFSELLHIINTSIKVDESSLN